ncbi:hypothetical protein C4546_00675 [Candidatus Parcubacteria bacterium]|jgi:Tol biopolymer transport system component|nr:MAG: hypothetical protein C4546_00675 [Candidatus Parcubacteria bacterium]
MNKRVLLIIAFVIGVIVIGFVLYLVFFKPLPPAGNQNQNENVNAVLPNLNGNVNRPQANVNGGLPNINGANVNQQVSNINAGLSPIANGQDTLVKTLVSANASNTIVDASGNLKFYDKVSGQFFKLDANGNMVALSQVKFPDAESVVWSPTGNKVIVSFPDDSKIYYDFDAKQQATLPREAQGFSFDPTGTQIAFKYNSANVNDRFLVISNPDGTSMSPIEPLGENSNKVQVSWSPNNQVVATYSEGLNENSQQVYLVGKSGENNKSILAPGRGFEGSWSPDGQRMLYSVYNSQSNYNPVLHIVDAQGDSAGGNNLSLDLQTWSDKCTFSKSGIQVYCAVPQANSLPAGSGIYRDQARNASDEFYAVDLTTGAKTKLAVPVGSDGSRQFSAVNLKLSADGKTLYFTDSVTGRILQMRLQ